MLRFGGSEQRRREGVLPEPRREKDEAQEQVRAGREPFALSVDL